MHLPALIALLSLLILPPAAAQFQRAGGNPFQPPRATPHYARDRDYTMRHLRLVFDVNVPAHSAHGVVTHYLTPLRDQLRSVVFDAGANLKIEACRLDDADVPFRHDQDQLILTPPAPLPRGKEVTVEIRYTMPGGATGGGANGVGGFHWVDPDPRDPERKPGFWTQGETETNRNWVPCYDYPNNKATSETIVTVPENWEVIGNGIPGQTTHDTAHRTRTYRWTMKQPHSSYLLSLVAGELDIRKSSWAGVPLYYVVPKGKADLIEGSFGNTPDMLQFFSDRLGYKYPWPKYAQCAVFDFPGGMENVTATTLGQNALTDRRSGLWGMASLTSHELAHQWFGDLVTCESWGDSWLNEGFATYFEMLYMEHLRGREQGVRERESGLRSYLAEAQRYKRPISTRMYDKSDNLFDASAYSRPALVLHMLMLSLGEDNFYRGLRHYLEVNAYKPVDAHDLEKALTEATGRNVEPFFDQWIFKPGHPVLDYDWKYDDAKKAVILHVKQTQDTADGTPIYSLPLHVALIRKDGIPEKKSPVGEWDCLVDKADVTNEIPVSVKPDALLIDPDHDLIKSMQNHWADTELPAILRYAPAGPDRMEAARKLADGTPDEAKIGMLAEALRAEQDDETAAQMLPLVSGLKMDAAHKEALRPLLLEQARSKQPARRAAALEALGNLPRTDEEVALLRAAALSDTEPYRVVLAAMGALGKLDTAANLDVYRHQVAVPSRFDQLARRVVDVLSKANLDAAAPILLQAAQPPHRRFVRTDAIEALQTIALNDASIHTALLNLLNNGEDADVQVAAARALKARKDKEAVPALRSLAEKSKNPDVREAAKDAADNLAP